MFRLSSEPLNPAAYQPLLQDVRAGACVTFEGWVRNQNEGQAVESLEYEAYAPLAEKEGQRIIEEALAKFQVANAICFHRVGHLQLGETAVWVGVAAGHRGAAFDACRYIIDETKARVPIWKKEHYASGVTAWINCATRGEYSSAAAQPPA